jgi:hypothetical protein
MTALLSRVGTQARAAEPATPAGRGRLREACHRIRLTVQELTQHAANRMGDALGDDPAGSNCNQNCNQRGSEDDH